MTLPDLIISWPMNCDYPLFRAFIRANRLKFNKVIIVFTYTNSGEDYRQFVNDSMQDDQCLILVSPKPTGYQDWRNVAVNYALSFSQSEWIVFLEQDFFIIDELFWREVDKYSITHQVIGVFDGPRLHPCCLFIERGVLNKTSKNFGIIPNKLDHFGIIQNNLNDLGQPIAEINKRYYHHMNGLSHNCYLAYTHQEVTYKPDEFREYMITCLTIDSVPLDPRFVTLARSIARN